MSAAALEIEPVDATFGAVVRGVRLAALDDGTWAAIHAAWLEHALLIFPGQFLTRAEQDTFARRFGELEFAASPISNIDKEGNVHSRRRRRHRQVAAGQRGLAPRQHLHAGPGQGRGVHGRDRAGRAARPPGGPTCGRPTRRSTSRAAHAWPGCRRTTRCTTARDGPATCRPTANDAGWLRPATATTTSELPLRPLVKVHPDTGRPNLLIGRHAYGIVGMDPDESERLLDELNDGRARTAAVYYHQWEVGDAVIWDNRRLMHRATPFDMTQPRRMWHTRIAGDPETELAVNH